MKKILIIEDDREISSVIEQGLREENYQTKVAYTGEKGLEEFHFWNPDLIILDLMLPGITGLQVCYKIREKGTVPILILSALNTSENVALGLDSGADDYLMKPFKFIELHARIRSLLRRIDYTKQSTQSTYVFEDLVVDDIRKTATLNGNVINLTSTEYRLLVLFVQHPNKVFSRLEILDQIWGDESDVGTNVVDVYVNYLRKKIQQFDNSKLIHTVIGMGYVMRKDS